MERGTRRTASSRSPTCTPRPNIAAKWPPCSLGGRSSAPSPGRRATRREDCRHLQASWRARAGLGAAERSGAAGQVLARLRAARAGWTGPLQSGHQVCPRRCFGQIHGLVELADKKPPRSLRLRLEGKGVPGFVKGEGKLELTEKQGQTEVRYTGEAQIGGMIAAIGQRMIEGAARKMIQQFFESAAAQLQAPARKVGGGR